MLDGRIWYEIQDLEVCWYTIKNPLAFGKHYMLKMASSKAVSVSPLIHGSRETLDSQLDWPWSD